jgi:hypothetical protein
MQQTENQGGGRRWGLLYHLRAWTLSRAWQVFIRLGVEGTNLLLGVDHDWLLNCCRSSSAQWPLVPNILLADDWELSAVWRWKRNFILLKLVVHTLITTSGHHAETTKHVGSNYSLLNSELHVHLHTEYHSSRNDSRKHSFEKESETFLFFMYEIGGLLCPLRNKNSLD